MFSEYLLRDALQRELMAGISNRGGGPNGSDYLVFFCRIGRRVGYRDRWFGI